MTSRVEAVADVLARRIGRSRHEMIPLAEDVIEASDAWLERHYSPKRTIKRKLLTEESDQ